MNRLETRLMQGVLAAALCVATTGWAGIAVDLPPVRMQGGVTYMSGGIGLDEQAAMKEAASEYSLELEFVESGEAHEFLTASVQVKIVDRAGKVVLDARSDGPLLLAMLPAGQYTVSAENSGSVKTREVSIVRNRRTTVMFQWRA